MYPDILLGVGYSDKSRNATRTIYFSIGIAEQNHAKTEKNPPTKPSRIMLVVKSKKKARASHFDKELRACISGVTSLIVTSW